MVRPPKAVRRQACMSLCVGSRDRDRVGFCMEAQQRFCLLASVPFCVLALPLVMCGRSNGRKENDPWSDPSRQLCSEDFIPTLEGKVGLNGSPFVASVRE